MSSIDFYSKKKKFLIYCITVILGATSIIAIVEFSSYLYIKSESTPRFSNKSLNQFITTNPLAFEGVDDFEDVKKDWAGLTNCPKNRIINELKSGVPYYELSEVNCDGPVNIRNGLRVTIDQPLYASRKILMFGGSTMWGPTNSDRNTIASLLQKRINKISSEYAVHNHGFTTLTISQELLKLRATKIERGDIVIFYDGGNDIWQGVIYGKPKGTIIGYNDTNFVHVVANRIKYFFSENSFFYKILAKVKNKELSNMKSDCQRISDEVLITREIEGFAVYKNNIFAAKQFVESHGGHFFHFLQPTIASRVGGHSDYEKNLLEHFPPEMGCGVEILREANAYYRKRYLETLPEINGHDLTQILNPKNLGKEFYLDWIHVTANGNQIISDVIFNAIKKDIFRK